MSPHAADHEARLGRFEDGCIRNVVFGVGLGEARRQENGINLVKVERRTGSRRPRTSGVVRAKTKRKVQNASHSQGDRFQGKADNLDFDDADTALRSALQQSRLCKKNGGPNAVSTTYQKRAKVRQPIGDEFWVSEASKLSIEQYAKADAAKAAESDGRSAGDA